MTQHRVANARLHRAFAGGYYTARDIPIRDYTDRFQVVDAFDNGNLTAIVPGHYLRCLPHRVFGCAAGNIGNHDVVIFHRWRMSLIRLI
jgi:hypothetical protein